MSKPNQAHFVSGSILRHVIIMTFTSTVALMSLFVVDLIDLYFINMLGEQEMAASIGFSSQILFFLTALSIGLLVAMGVLVSQRIGAKNTEGAKEIATSTLVIAVLFTLLISSILIYFLDDILVLLGAKGRTLELGHTYASIILPSTPILTIAMISGSIMRSVGDAKRSMNAIIFGALVNLILDPILIFYFDLGIAGAAYASVAARFTMLFYGLFVVINIHNMLIIPTISKTLSNLNDILSLAIPAMLTNLATPIGSMFVMASVAKYGDSAVAAFAIVGRIVPVAFGTLFALSGSIAPIIGQNYGAKEFSRVRETLKSSIIFIVSFVLFICTVLFFGKEQISNIFNLTSEARELFILFCSGLTLFFIFDGILFATNATFNSLGYPLYSTVFNYAKVLLGVIPFVWVLSNIYQAKGVLIGQSLGSIIVSIVAVIVCYRLIANIEKFGSRKKPKMSTRPPLWAGSSSKTQV